MDPPEHALYRQPLAALFSPGIVTQLRGSIQGSARRLVAEIAPRGECDFVSAFGRPFPTETYTEMLGGDEANATDLVGWTERILHGKTPDVRRRASLEAIAYLTELIEERRSRPRGDVLSSIVHLDIAGRRITLDESIRAAYLLMLAGLDTVTASLSFAMWFLAESKTHRDYLVEHPDKIPGAVDELLRRVSVANAVRVCKQDVDFAGVRMRSGDVVILPPIIASRDPETFPNPAVVDFDRPNANRHVAFGAGPHRCLGAHLAREQMRVALSEWHRIIPDYHTQQPLGPIAYWDTIIGLRHLPLAW